ncbi:MAG: T9SS type A sorting domain-containing protein [Candidatus Cloacimonetes bacterium]|nr:T9SS type A sorting domain-containing protein [Candidatus Cloacimonadota bacterium]
MKKTILSIIIFFICICFLFASNKKGNDFKYLQINEKEFTDKINNSGPPPTNLHAIGQYLEIYLDWDEADFTNTFIQSQDGSSKNSYNTSRDTVLLGYNIYRDSTFTYTVEPNVTEYSDEIVYPGRDYTYWVTAVYGDGESIPSNSDTASAWSNSYMPDYFWEDWAITGKWYEIPASPNNWEHDATYQAARFNWSPSTPNYDMSLVSEEFTLPADTSLIFDFTVNMYIDDYPDDTGEKMEIWLWHDSLETMIFQWDLDEHDDWGVSGGQDWVYTDTDQFAGETVKIKFRSHGGDTFNISYWYVYSVWFKYNVLPDYGILEGVVTDGEGEPLEMVAVQANYSKYNPVYTNEDGEYLIDPIVSGTYDVTFSKDDYPNLNVVDVEIVKDSTTVLNVVLGQPTMNIQPITIQEIVEPDEPVSVPITVANNGTGSLNYYVERISENKIDYIDCIENSPVGHNEKGNNSIENYINQSGDINKLTDWLTFSPDSGFVEAGNTDEVTVYLNTSDHNPGEVLTGQLEFTSDPNVGSQIVDIEVEVGECSVPGQEEVAKTFLQGCFPNPATGITTIKYSIKKPTHVKLSIYNIKGRLVETLVEEHSESGMFELQWNPQNINTGIYFLQLKTEEKTYLKKMIMMK